MRKIFLSALATLLVMGLVGAGTFALFSDTETSSGNSFTAGTLNLKVSDWNEGPGDGVTATWTMSDMVPGVTTVGPFSVLLTRSGSVTPDHVEISFSHSIDEATNPVESDTDPASTPGEMARWLEITSMTYNGVDFKATYTDANGNGIFDLEDVTLSPYIDVGGPLDNLLVPIGAGTRSFTMALKFNEGATDDIQGDGLAMTVTFTLNQDATQ